MAVAVERRPGLIVARFSGEVSTADLAEAANQFDQIDQVVPGLPRLADTTEMTGVSLDFAATGRFAHERRSRSRACDVRMAILVSSDLAFGIARIYQSLLAHPQIKIEVFRGREEALAWLGVGPTS